MLKQKLLWMAVQRNSPDTSSALHGAPVATCVGYAGDATVNGMSGTGKFAFEPIDKKEDGHPISPPFKASACCESYSTAFAVQRNVLNQ